MTGTEAYAINSMRTRGAALIVNADDWGRDRSTTDRTLDCARSGAVSSVSAMVFMADSERAADLARKHGVDAGLHLNLTEAFNSPACPPRLNGQLEKLARYLGGSRYARMIYHPGLAAAFEYVVQAQMEEYERLYGTPPRRVDGHQHMHLCANILRQGLLPAGAIARRNFTFEAGEKDFLNRLYRRRQDRRLAERHPLTDYFFDLAPVEQRERLERIAALASRFNVELETHPAREAEYRFLMDGELARLAGANGVARGYGLRYFGRDSSSEGSVGTPRLTAAGAEGTAEEPLPRITVCVCTYKRPRSLKRTLAKIEEQESAGLFTVSIVVCDNDEERSAESTVAEMQKSCAIQIKYVVEPRRSIALARNRVLENAEGTYLALIDDDEVPGPAWLQTLFNECNAYNVAGVLGPVLRHFDEEPPGWFRRSGIYARRVNPTGMIVDWREARTGNVLMKRQIVAGETGSFRPEFRAGEDHDFFRRKIEEGYVFIWSSDAAVFETIPPSRWKRGYILRKATLQGATAAQQPNCGAISIAKSIVAVPLYTLIAPFALLRGQHYFMRLMDKICFHSGKLLMRMGINPIREEYVSG